MKKGFSRVPSDIFPPGVCELTVGYKRKAEKRKKIHSSLDIASFAREFLYEEGTIEYSELFFVLFLDRSHQVYAYKQLSSGGMTGTVVDPRLLFQAALLCHAYTLILIHNHCSGNIQPSGSDIGLTKQISEAGRLLEIKILDHIILTTDGYYSFSDEGLV
jgi:DNA repair protein RadC